MYTAVLMLAMTSASDSMDFGRRGCSGRSGCSAYGCSSGYGNYGGGCYGGAAYGRGCYGGGYSGGCCGGGYPRSSYYGGPGYYGASVNYNGGMVITSNAPMQMNRRAPATMVVSVPARTRLTIDGVTTKSTGETRTFITPELEPGTSFVYNVEATFGDNPTAAQTRQVIVRAGETSVVRFDVSPSGTAAR